MQLTVVILQKLLDQLLRKLGKRWYMETSSVQMNLLFSTSVNGIHGKEATPFLLQRITEITKGDSLTASRFHIEYCFNKNKKAVLKRFLSDIALVKNNATVGAQIAVELAKLKKTPVA
jgi:pseudouridine-5'-phosphate glycosidase